MKLNTKQRTVLSKSFMELANLVGAAYIIGALMRDDIPVLKITIVAGLFIGLYISAIFIMPRYIDSKKSAHKKRAST